MIRLICQLCAIAFALIGQFYPAAGLWANDTAYFGSGRTVVPINNHQIRMVSESIRISRDGNKFADAWKVQCRFVFKNESNSAATVLMGFPDSYERYPYETEKKWTIRNFKAGIQDTPLKVEHRIVDNPKKPILGEGEDGAYVWNVNFEAGETITVLNSYETGAVESPPQFFFTYVVKTGARWQGNIEDAEFDIDLSKMPYSPFFEIRPKPHTVEAGVYRLRFRDFKPDFNIEIRGAHEQRGGEPISDVIYMMGSEMGKYADLDELRGYSEPPPPPPPGFLERLRDQVFGKTGPEQPASMQPPKPPRRPYSQSPLFQFLASRGIDRETASLLRNYVFASHGRTFDNPKLRVYFSGMKWYKPDPDYSDARLSDFDREFVATVKAYEESLPR